MIVFCFVFFVFFFLSFFVFFFFFFFQAEDGIRDGTVTGVQTCALPIYFGPPRSYDHPERSPQRVRSRDPPLLPPLSLRQPPLPRRGFSWETFGARSEERRVGKGVDLGGRRSSRKKKRVERLEEDV